MKLKLLIAAGLIVLCGPTLAQSCGGMANVNGVCIPPDQESSPLNDSYGNQGDSSASTTPQIIWADSWGAIADDGKSVSSTVVDLPSKRKAKRAALEKCQSLGGRKCSIAVVYKNQCAVIVAGNVGSNVVSAPTIEQATEMGIKSCKAKGNADCWVHYSGCSFARRIQ